MIEFSSFDDLTSWGTQVSPTVVGGQESPDGGTDAYLVGDDDAGTYEAIYKTQASPGDTETVTRSFWIKEQPANGVYPGLRIRFDTGGTSYIGTCHFNPETGEIWEATQSVGFDLFTVQKIGGWWLIDLTLTNNGTGNTRELTYLLPAATTYTNGVADPAATGTVTAFVGIVKTAYTRAPMPNPRAGSYGWNAVRDAAGRTLAQGPIWPTVYDDMSGLINPTPDWVGGKQDYSDMVLRASADHIVTTGAELKTAMTNATANEIIYVDNDIDYSVIGYATLSANGVTIAGARNTGVDTVATMTNTYAWHINISGDDCRITGLKFVSTDDTVGVRGIQVTGARIEIDNCEFHGYYDSAIYLNTGADDAYIHHCAFLNLTIDVGVSASQYGVTLAGASTALIEACVQDSGRHMVAATGGSSQCYEARYNITTEDVYSHAFDVHELSGGAGDQIYIHHNVVYRAVVGTISPAAVSIRHTPASACWADYNAVAGTYDQPSIAQYPTGVSNDVAPTDTSYVDMRATGNIFSTPELLITNVDGDNDVYADQANVEIDCIDAGEIKGIVEFGGIVQTDTDWPATESGASTITVDSIDVGSLPLGLHELKVLSPINPYGNDLVMKFHIEASGSRTLAIRGDAGGTYLYDIDWGDGTVETDLTVASPSHTYAGGIDPVVRISGLFSQLSWANIGNKSLLIKVLNHGSVGHASARGMYYGCNNLVSIGSFVSDFSATLDFYAMFANCMSLTEPPDLSFMVGLKPTDLTAMFYGLMGITRPPLLRYIDTSEALTMASMLGNWASAGAVDIPIDEWTVDKCTNFTNFLVASTLTTECYDRVLRAWSQQTLVNTTVINMGSSKYSDVTAHADMLAAMNGYALMDGGEDV